MINPMHGDPNESSVERMARHLMEAARQEPSLLGRRHAIMRPPPTEMRSEIQPFDLSYLGRVGRFNVLQQVEELTSIAITSAQEAEATFQQACQTIRSARRGMAVVGAFGVLGILMGVAAIADNHLRWDAPIALAQADSPPAPATKPLPSQPVTYVPPLPVPPTSTPVAAPAPAPAPAPMPKPFVPPAYHPPQTYAAPWPSERVAVVVPRAAPVPQFVVALRRGINSILEFPRNF
jgi:hypothetical protein